MTWSVDSSIEIRGIAEMGDCTCGRGMLSGMGVITSIPGVSGRKKA
jgi:hypothetical protein